MATQEEINAIYNGQIEQPTFEGAATSYRLSQKGLLHGDVDSLAARELLNLQMRSAHAIRNNGHAKAALLKYTTSLGAVKINWKDKDGKKHELAQELWDEFAKSPNYDGYGTLDNTQSVWHSSIFQSGNAFTQLLIVKSGNKNRVPLKLKSIPSEMHDVLYMGTNSKDKIKTGIKFKDSKPVSYYFRKGIYNSIWYGEPLSASPQEVKAKELVHIFIRETPGQWLGIPSLAPVLLSLYELDELTDATIAKQKAAQAISWIVENTNPVSLTPTGTPVSVTDPKDSKKNKVVFKAQGGSTQYLNKGEKIHFYQSTDIGANLPNLIASELRRIASAVGIPYHSLTGDTSGLDFSSLRAIAIELRSRLEYIHHFYTIPLGLSPIALRFKELAELRYNVSDAMPSFQLPRWYGVDDLKDTQADLLEVQNGMATLESKLDERHTTYEEIAADRERMASIGLNSLLGTSMEGVSTSQISNINPNANSTSN